MTFREIYAEELARARAERPDEYCWPAEQVPTVVAKMVSAFAKGTGNKNSIAVRRACRRCGIPYTYAGLRAACEGAQ